MAKHKFYIESDTGSVLIKALRKRTAIDVFKKRILETPCKLFLSNENKYYQLSRNDLSELEQIASVKGINYGIVDGEFIISK